MNELYANVNGIKICYDINGKGDNIILIHGFGNKKERWIAQVGSLSQQFKVITYDNRGAGKSDRPNDRYTMEIFADDIQGLMDFLKIRKADVIGTALGGMIAISFALNYAERLKKLVLINTPPELPDNRGAEILKKSAIEELQRLKKDPEEAFWQKVRINYHRTFRKQLEANPKKRFYGLWSIDDIIREKTINPPTIQDIENQVHAIKKFKSLERLNEIQNETLLIASSHSRLHPKSVMVNMHQRIPNATLKIIENAGDNVELSRAPEVNQIILDFLEN